MANATQASWSDLNGCIKGFFCQPFYDRGMTFAEFIGACFWPLVILFGLLLARTKDPVLFRWFLTAALVTGFTYFGLWFLDQQSSVIAVLDFYVLGVLFGLVGFGFGLNELRFKKPFDLKTNLKWAGFLLFGAAVAGIFATIVYQDLFQERRVIEGRAQNPRIQAHYRGVDYVVDIAGRTVKMTVRDRLESGSYVRAEIGRGSNYIYRIEYLTN
jgi:hypothetical protein